MTNAFRTACQKTGYLVASLKTCVAARLARSGAGASLMKLSDRKRAALFHYAWVNTPIADIFQVKVTCPL